MVAVILSFEGGKEKNFGEVKSKRRSAKNSNGLNGAFGRVLRIAQNPPTGRRDLGPRAKKRYGSLYVLLGPGGRSPRSGGGKSWSDQVYCSQGL